MSSICDKMMIIVNPKRKTENMIKTRKSKLKNKKIKK